MRNRHPTLHTKYSADGEPDEGFRLELKDPPLPHTRDDLSALEQNFRRSPAHANPRRARLADADPMTTDERSRGHQLGAGRRDETRDG